MKILYSRHTFLFSLFLIVVLLAPGCKKSSNTPEIMVTLPVVATTSAILNLTATTAQSGGIVLSRGNATITANGVCFSATNKTPTTADSKTSDPTPGGTAITSFVSNLTGLTAKTTYYLRAYATNSAGTGYGGVLTFTTTDAGGITATVTTLAGSATSGYVDASGTSAEFNNPQGVSVDQNGNVYVSDSFNDLIRKVTPGGDVSTVAGMQTIGYADGPAATAQFYAPAGSAFDTQGNLYVADFGNNVIRKITPSGTVSTYAGAGVAGYADGVATSANVTSTSSVVCKFNNPQGVAVDAAGNVYVADRGNNAIRKITPAGKVTTLAGRKSVGFIDATGAAAAFNDPSGVAVDANGNVYVTDQGNSSLRKITAAGAVITLVGNPSQSSLLNFPSGIAIDKQGNLFITDEGGRVIEFTTEKVLNILAGSPNNAGFADGVNNLAQFNNPQGIAVDANGNIYVADQYNNSIRKITLSVGGVI